MRLKAYSIIASLIDIKTLKNVFLRMLENSIIAQKKRSLYNMLHLSIQLTEASSSNMMFSKLVLVFLKK